MPKKVLMVIAPNDFKDAEYLIPRRILEEGGVEVKVASLTTGEAKGAEGAKVSIDLTVDEVRAEEWEAVLFVGGPGMADFINNEKFISLAKSFFQAGKITSAICIAPAILGNAGLVKNKKVTAWVGIMENLKKQGANFTGQNVESDGQIITANGPRAAQEFGQKILAALS